MMKKPTLALGFGLLAAACSNEPAATPDAETETTATVPADADDDSLEPDAPKIEEGEAHNEDAPHSH